MQKDEILEKAKKKNENDLDENAAHRCLCSFENRL